MFVGDYSGKIDAKGRMIIPSQFRKNCEGVERFVLRKSIYDNSLEIYTFSMWQKEVDDFVTRLNPRNRVHATLIREFYRGTAELALDAAGRVLMPKRLLEAVGIEKAVVLVGLGNKIAVWDETTYEAAAMSQEEFEKLVEQELG